ncbi:MAG TPA: HD domain-containing protein, partial [Anaerolineae bacterium]|nr:HD domain-containing protein [Anaerolineae bacterium]
MISSSLQVTPENITDVLNTELAAIAGEYAGRDGSQAAIRESLKAYRAVLRHFLQTIIRKHNKNEPGHITCRMISDVMDRFVAHAYRRVFSEENSAQGTAVIALGGYGRRELNPSSDIDLLWIIHDDAAEKFERKISEMLQFLWDMNLDLGHSTRSIAECINAAQNDTYFATSLLEGRFLLGDKAVWNELTKQYTAWLREGPDKQLVMQKIEERYLRLDAYHRTVQIQVPNIKECPGALRDIHVSRWLLQLTGRGKNIHDMYTTGLVSEEESCSLQNDLDFLLKVRNVLHFLAGKKADVLFHAVLPDVARNLGYTGEGVRPVEKLMHDYYMRAGRVYYLTNNIIEKILKDFYTESEHNITNTPEGLHINEKYVHIPDELKTTLCEHPGIIVTLFTVAGTRGLRITDKTLSFIEEAIEKCSGDLIKDTEVQVAFHNVFNMREGIARTLRLMHEYGVLIKLIPEFCEINWHYQYDFYHSYTTDEHSIRVVENLEHMALLNGSTAPELSEIMADISAKGSLYLAGLLHDVGKGGGRGHAHRGEIMASRALKRLGFDERTIEIVRFLIREHLLMNHISQRRDMDDEDTIRDFIKRVGSAGRLRMLTLLTFADLKALSEGALTEWKKALIWRLYHHALVLIEKGFEHYDTVSQKLIIDTVVHSLSEYFPRNIIREHLSLLPEQYIRVTHRRFIRTHIRGIEHMKRHGTWISFQRGRNVTFLTVIAPDHPRALSDICGTITSSDINIVGARIFTRNDGI